MGNIKENFDTYFNEMDYDQLNIEIKTDKGIIITDSNGGVVREMLFNKELSKKRCREGNSYCTKINALKMKIKDLRNFINSLPEDFDEYPVVFREVSKFSLNGIDNPDMKLAIERELKLNDLETPDDYTVFKDFPISGAGVDESTNEFYLVEKESQDIIDSE